jgi:hypothetical protein
MQLRSFAIFKYGLFPEVDIGYLLKSGQKMLRPLIDEVPPEMAEADNCSRSTGSVFLFAHTILDAADIESGCLGSVQQIFCAGRIVICDGLRERQRST